MGPLRVSRVKMLNTGRIENASIIAALFGVWSFALLMPNR